MNNIPGHGHGLSKTCANGACQACCGCGDCVTYLAGEPEDTRWNCTCKSKSQDPGSTGDPSLRYQHLDDYVATRDHGLRFDKHRVASAPDPFIGGTILCKQCGGCKCGGKRHRNCGKCECGASSPTESIIDLLAKTLDEGCVSESMLAEINKCFDFDVIEKKTAKGAHGGGHEYKQIELDHEFVDLADRAPQSKKKPKKSDEPQSDPGEGETGEKPHSQKTPAGFEKSTAGLPKEKDKPGKTTKNGNIMREAFDRELDAILENEHSYIMPHERERGKDDIAAQAAYDLDPETIHARIAAPGVEDRLVARIGATCFTCGKSAKWFRYEKGPIGNKQKLNYCSECALSFGLNDVVEPIHEGVDPSGCDARLSPESSEERVCVLCGELFVVDLSGLSMNNDVCEQCKIDGEINRAMSRHWSSE